MKTFGKRNCMLCAKERLAIVKEIWRNKDSLINSNTEIYGACRHRAHFHRYKNNGNRASTDETTKVEIVEPDTNLGGNDSARIHSQMEGVYCYGIMSV